MRIKREDELLEPGVRKQLIEEIESSENKRRKDEAFRRWQVNKDRTADFVIELLLNQFQESTVRAMGYSITNISVCRKIVNKLARVYAHGVNRKVTENEQATESLQSLAKLINANEKLKRQNRMLKLQRNAVMYVKPCPYFDADGNEKVKIRLSPTNPYLYDVVEEFYDRTEPMAYVLNNYSPSPALFTTRDPARVRDHALGGARNSSGLSVHSTNQGLQGDGKDQLIADKKEDEDIERKTYIVWTDKYHFTMNEKAEIVDASGRRIEISTEEGLAEIENPFGVKPFVNTAIDQDNSYWAEGGEDLVDGAIVINSLYTQANHIAVTQGYGQFFMTGKDLPNVTTHGPDKAILAEYDPEAGDPKPEIGFASANPPLKELRDQIEGQVALLLTTNNMSTSHVSGQLDGSQDMGSGIALIIDKSESLEDVKDQQQVFIDAEDKLWPIVAKQMQFYNEQDMLDPEQAEFMLPEDFNVTLEFGEPDVIQSENEKLDALQKRVNLGLNTEVEMVMLESGLDEMAAREKLAQLKEEKKARIEEMGPQFEEAPGDGDDEPQDQEDQS